VDATWPQRKRTNKEHFKKDLEIEMWTAGYKNSWKEMGGESTE